MEKAGINSKTGQVWAEGGSVKGVEALSVTRGSGSEDRQRRQQDFATLERRAEQESKSTPSA